MSRPAAIAAGTASPRGIATVQPTINRQLRRIEASIDRDPELAIGTAKKFVESMCRTFLAERGQPVTGTPDIPALNLLTLKELQLLPDHTHNQSKGTELMKRLLSNLATVTQTLAELRGLYGTGRRKDRNTIAIEPRHAKLVVGAAATLATFLYEKIRNCRSNLSRCASGSVSSVFRQHQSRL